MPERDVYFSVPERPLAKADIVFIVDEDGERLGTLKISKGGLDWLPARKWRDKPFRLDWSRFDRLIREQINPKR